jgi:hypothetical protein
MDRFNPSVMPQISLWQVAQAVSRSFDEMGS